MKKRYTRYRRTNMDQHLMEGRQIKLNGQAPRIGCNTWYPSPEVGNKQLQEASALLTKRYWTGLYTNENMVNSQQMIRYPGLHFYLESINTDWECKQ